MAADAHKGHQSAWPAVGRPIVAYCAASFVAAFILLGPWPWGGLGSSSPSGPANLMKYWLITSLIVAAVAALPTFLIAPWIFVARIPRGIGDICAGALVGPLILLVFVGYGVFLPPDPMIFQIMIAGAAAGAAYWLLVGRPRHVRATDPSGESTN